jgi:V/A-type H+-transporting ATPase subunit C
MASAYLDTRVSLYAHRLWDDATLDHLVDVSEAELVETLALRGLPQLIGGFRAADGATPDARSLEQRIVAQLLEETRVLMRPLGDGQRGFLTYWTARFEVNNLKTLLRGTLIGERPAALLASLTPMGGFARVDETALAHAEDLAELLRRLEASPYAAIVREARHAFEQTHDPFHLDAALDRGYYEGLGRRAEALEREAGAGFVTLMDRLFARINLVWLLRYRFNYGLPPAQVYYLLIASRYGLSGARLRDLVGREGIDAVLAALPAFWRTRLAGAHGIAEVFARMEQLAAAQARALLAPGKAAAFVRAFAYLILRERDLRAVRGILRGRHLGLPARAIRQAIERAPVGSH